MAALNQMVSSVGDGSGTTEMAAAGAVYKVAPAVDWTYELYRINGYIEDNGKFQGAYYGATEALATGITLTVENASGTIATLTPYPITKIGHWALVAGVDMKFTDFSVGNDMCMIRWTFAKSGPPIRLRGDDGEFLKFTVGDNLGVGGAALVSHLFQVQGVSGWTG